MCLCLVFCVCACARENAFLLQRGRMALAHVRHSQIQEERQQHEHAALLLLQVLVFYYYCYYYGTCITLRVFSLTHQEERQQHSLARPHAHAHTPSRALSLPFFPSLTSNLSFNIPLLFL